MDEIIGQAIANFPNFAGFILLSFALWRVMGQMQDMLHKQIERYDRLVMALLEMERLTPQQVARLFDRIESGN